MQRADLLGFSAACIHGNAIDVHPRRHERTRIVGPVPGALVTTYRVYAIIEGADPATAKIADLDFDRDWEIPDKFPNLPRDLETPDKFPSLAVALTARGYKPDEVTKILGENWLRLFKEVWED